MIQDAFWGILIPFLGTSLGAGCVFFLKNSLRDGIQRALTGFAAGVMVAASVWSLLIPAMEQAADLGRLAFFPAAAGFWLGILFLLLLDHLIPHLHQNSLQAEGPKSQLQRTTMMVLAVTLHNIPEGMAVGVVYAGYLAGTAQITAAGALALSIGIAIQNFPEGAIISMPLRAEGIKKGRAFWGGVLSGIGGFGGLFELDMTGITKPVLVSGTDGVGTKLKIAFLMDKHDTVGIDCVAMCVNDIICCGAKPQFFLDYIAVGKNYPEKIAQIVSGVAEGCVQSGCALIGGETAEMPGFYPVDEYDLAGFSVGVVDKDKILDPSTQKAGDVMIAIKSSGVHSNGFSLVRKVFSVDEKTLSVHYDELGKTLGETLLTPTKIYVKAVMSLLDSVKVKAISHITGGGFYENIPRSLPSGLSVKIARSDVQVLPIFDVIAKTGNIPERDMFNTFNMGVGMTVVVDKADADKAIEAIKAAGEEAYVLGELVDSDMGVIIC